MVRPMVQVNNKVGMLLMEAGVNYNKQKRQKAGYFRGLLGMNPDIDPGRRSLPRQRREMVDFVYSCISLREEGFWEFSSADDNRSRARRAQNQL